MNPKHRLPCPQQRFPHPGGEQTGHGAAQGGLQAGVRPAQARSERSAQQENKRRRCQPEHGRRFGSKGPRGSHLPRQPAVQRNISGQADRQTARGIRKMRLFMRDLLQGLVCRVCRTTAQVLQIFPRGVCWTTAQQLSYRARSMFSRVSKSTSAVFPKRGRTSSTTRSQSSR